MLFAADLIIFDFDGVIADSETLSNALLAEFLTAEGRPTTMDDSMRLFMGRRWSDNLERIAVHLGRPLAVDFDDRYKAFVRPRMRSEVVPVPGVKSFIESFGDRAQCIASSSSHDWLNHTTGRFGFADRFEGRMFSGTEVANGKPAPDLFLLAAERMGVAPARSLVIEDSPAGIVGARAAGMTAIGLTAGSHARAGHDARLLEAGAHHVFADFDSLAVWLTAQ
jgi:HAD superfamily hydrolase (TIGR01509 family)